MLLSNKTFSIECYSETSINCVFTFCCYFVSTVYCSLDVFYVIIFMSFFTLIPCCMCVCHMFIKVVAYLLQTQCTDEGREPLQHSINVITGCTKWRGKLRNRMGVDGGRDDKTHRFQNMDKPTVDRQTNRPLGRHIAY